MGFKLIGISGSAGAGKDTVGDYFKESLNFTIYAFADPIKKACVEIFGVPLNHFYDVKLKEQVIPFWEISPREMAQLLGTECCRNIIRKDIWVRRGKLEWDNIINDKSLTETFGRITAGLVITDVRFQNEAEWIKKEGGILLHIERSGMSGNVGIKGHLSESGYSDILKDYVIHNNGTIDELYTQINNIMKEIKC